VPPETVRIGYWLLSALSLAKYGIVLLDFRLTLNHHYMALWVLALFLAVPTKRQTIPVLIALFYLWAGLLKVAPGSEWTTGAAFYGRRPLGMPASWIPAACRYVVLLELAGSMLLLARSSGLFWLTLAQFALFHISSFWVVGFYYPVLMFLLLAILPLRHYFGVAPVVGAGRIVASVAVVVLFSLCQVVPRMLPGDSALTGEGRIFALNMFDAPVQCRAWLRPVRSDSHIETVLLRGRFLNTRLWCDPIVYLSLAKSKCKEIAGRNNDQDFQLVLESKRTSELNYHRVVDITNFCADSPRYSIWGHNHWIRIP
jgi:hypothetical protein